MEVKKKGLKEGKKKVNVTRRSINRFGGLRSDPFFYPHGPRFKLSVSERLKEDKKIRASKVK